MFSSLRVPSFRIYIGYLMAAVTGMWIQRVAQDWIMFELTGSLGSVGVNIAVQFLPTLLLGAFTGVVADRYRPHVVLTVTTSISVVLAALLFTLNQLGVLAPVHVYAIAAVSGTTAAIDNPTRWVLVSGILSARDINSAISVKSTVLEFGSLVGPLVSGLIIGTMGSRIAVLIAAGGALTAIVFLLRVPARDRPFPERSGGTRWGALREGLAYVRGRPAVLWALGLCALHSVFFWPMTPIFLDYAERVFKVGAAGYGLLTASLAAGATLGALVSAQIRREGTGYLFAVAGVAALLHALASLAPGPALLMAASVAMGVGHLLFVTAANAEVQAHSDSRMRGRALALYYVVINGGVVLGAPLMGVVTTAWGAPPALLFTGVAPLFAIAVLYAGYRVRRRGA
ncbi:MFS transporter [Acrocarpospora catenulata]|uniref:MFS transporter n=1 Tax=Acrocarpospora catenulata TaxID=2836182 RepID=UPI0021119554|nr:MFS transporter [Acrocarpospora catenulata]